MAETAQFLITGVIAGAAYALLSLTWALVRKVSGQLFFVSGCMVVLGVLGTNALTERGWPPAPAVVVVVASAGAVTLAADVLILRRVPRQTELSGTLVMLALAFVMEELLSLGFGPEPRQLAPAVAGPPVSFLGASLQRQQLLIVGATAVLITALVLAGRSRWGKAMRACAQNPTGAMLVGIHPTAVRTIGLVIAAALGALSGVLLGPVAAMAPASGFLLSLKGFIAAALGGWGFLGATVAGLFLGLTESLTAGYISSDLKDVVSLALLLLVLLGKDSIRLRRVGRVRISDDRREAPVSSHPATD
ncbi:branched-chain amino acid ABC transporter permease [Actinomadura decatromicini]|uniref:Branched-chain amino acid ABC transporter permease n=1 Tax=Actinomadura decatromicini TaxID=2604572 RepID=A0A5D3F460_9ACTN|nr:branched-chain amino acid ABC transporter permease [Actinomadura decatromicini]TYK43081.1 branched-chain amino acid ABC transporter permease [Actinomadura decatromicini]